MIKQAYVPCIYPVHRFVQSINKIKLITCCDLQTSVSFPGEKHLDQFVENSHPLFKRTKLIQVVSCSHPFRSFKVYRLLSICYEKLSFDEVITSAVPCSIIKLCFKNETLSRDFSLRLRLLAATTPVRFS